MDYPDGEVTNDMTIGGTIDVSIPATDAYTLELIAPDSDGNQQVEHLLDATTGAPILVTVFDDVDAPLVEGNPASFILMPQAILFLNSFFDLFQTVDVVQEVLTMTLVSQLLISLMIFLVVL